MLLVSPVSATASWFYGGWYATANWQGVDGLINQTVTTTLPLGTPAPHHMDWLGINNPAGTGWVQIGSYQGYVDGWSDSGSKVTIYTENADPCGYGENLEHGVPPTRDYAYYVYYDGVNFAASCSGREYEFEFKAGSINNPPLDYGYMNTSSGPAEINTEIYPTNTVTINTDYYGCDTTLTCTNQSWGMNLYNGTWHKFTTSYSAVLFDANPPFVHTYNKYWSFRTCRATC
jgi:hypothetical protein